MKKQKSERIVIIGSSVAAISAIEAIREKDKEIPVTVITREKDVSYSKPLISYPNLTKEQFYYRDKNFYKKNNIKLIFNEAIKIKDNSVVLETKKSIKYSKLLLAVGGKPIIPDIKGIDRKNVFTFTNYNDVEKIKAKLKKLSTINYQPSTIVIGCGMIGIKAAEFLRQLGLKITIVEIMDRPFASALDEKSGKIIAGEIRKNAKLILNNNVIEIKENACILKTGEKISADVVICAIGVVPNTDIAKKSGIKTNNGIVVDTFMKTSKKNVYAAGDCVEKAIPIWPIAHRQGEVAGGNIVGVKTEYEGGFVMNSVDVFGLPVITFGLSNFEDAEKIVSIDEKKYKKIIVKNKKIIGAIFVGDINRAGIIYGIIKDRIDVSNFKDELLKESFGYIYVPKEFRSEEVIPTEI